MNNSISGSSFAISTAWHGVPNVGVFWEYMTTIKETIINFDRILDSKINTPEVKAMQALIDSIG